MRGAVTGGVHATRRLFQEEVARSQGDLNLGRAALLVSKEQYPQLPVDRYLLRLDQLAEEVRGRLDDETAPPIVLEALVETLVKRNGLRGNRDAYYDPRNSFLNDVLDRGLGIPLTLAIVYLEVGWRLDLPLEGVNFPHHFLIRFRGSAFNLLIDPFDGGRIRFEDEAQELLDRFYGGMVRLRESFLRVAGKREILVRMLTNLKGLWINVADDPRALAAVERILILTPDATPEWRSRGLLLARLGRREAAIEQLSAYLDAVPNAKDSAELRDFVTVLERGESVDPPPISTGEDA